MAKFSRSLGNSIALTALAMALAPAAHAQSTGSAEEPHDESEIIVTGTLIKGVAPVGSAVLGISSEQIVETGAANATDLLRKLPQAGDFNSFPQPTNSSSIPYSPIQLRGIGGLSGMATLILIDGKRIVPTSPGHNWIDTQMIPAGAIERVEVVTDGGSSIYGSDAVAGVVNFVTKRKFKGVSASANYGDGKGNYRYWDATLTAGTEWQTGSAVLTYSYSHKNTLLGSDLDYLVEDKTAIGGQDNRSLSCSPGTITANSTTYALPTRAAGTRNVCSSFDGLSYYPAEQRHALFATLTQEFAPGVELEVNAFWSRRAAQISDPDNQRTSVTIANTNPYFVAVGAATSQDVAFSYDSVFGNREDPSLYEAWQVTPTLSVELGSKWSAKLGFNLGKSNSRYDNIGINATAQSAAINATTLSAALNPYNPSATNASVLAGIADFVNRESSHQEIQEARLVFDGSLFDLPAGPIKVAIGGELRKEVYNHFAGQGPAAAIATTTDTKRDRKVTSVFGEAFVPVLSNLRVSLSARYDHYDDVGSTTNPKVGFTFEPTDAITLRGSWGTSFHAPSLADLSAPLGYQLFLPISPFRAATSSFFPDFFKPTFLLGGASPGIKPEKATTWSIGTDIKPFDGAKISVSYFNINYKDRVDQNAGFFFGPGYYSDPTNAPYFILNPANPAAITAKFGNFPVIGFPDLQTMFNIFGTPYVVSDQRKQNLGTLKVDGIDFGVSYATDAAGGTLRLDANGTLLLNRDRETVPGSGLFETLDLGDFNSAISRFNGTASLGWGKGPFDASLSVYHRGSARVGNEKIGSFTTVGLFAKYDITKNVGVSLNVDNLFDTAPPARLVTNGVAYLDIGRVVKFGVNARF